MRPVRDGDIITVVKTSGCPADCSGPQMVRQMVRIDINKPGVIAFQLNLCPHVINVSGEIWSRAFSIAEQFDDLRS